VTSAAGASALPVDGLPEIALVGRSNVGKSSLVNALVGRRVARTSGAPGKTRLANIYRVAWGSAPAFYLVDLPGYGYARGGREAAHDFDTLARAYFERAMDTPGGSERQDGRDRQDGWERQGARELPTRPPQPIGALLLVDARHPGLPSDIDAWRWLTTVSEQRGVVATKIDKLARGQRIRAMREIESALDHPVLPVSANTGEGLDELWKLMDRLANGSSRNNSSSRRNNNRAATAPPLPKR